jgi:hypothetical protein
MDMFDRGKLERSLIERLPACSDDELRVISRVLDGIEQGRADYGPLHVLRDVRDWRREATLELRDWLFYMAAHEVAADARATERQAAMLARPTVIEIPPIDEPEIEIVDPDEATGGEG